jgi:hypothetical protein
MSEGEISVASLAKAFNTSIWHNVYQLIYDLSSGYRTASAQRHLHSMAMP